MKSIVLLAINTKYIHSSLSAWVLASSMNADIIEANINQDDNNIVKQVVAHLPDIVGISTYIWNAEKLPNIIKLIRGLLPEIVIVLGGPEASFNAEYWLERGADYIICGEGEHSFPALVKELERSDSSTTISKIINSTPLDSWYDPYSDDCITALKGKIAYIETSRGCPFCCKFCLSGRRASAGELTTPEDRIKFLPINVAKEQIHKLSESGARVIKFVDRTFNCNATRAYELFEYVISLNTKKCFHFEVAADLFDERTLLLLSSAPAARIQFEIGIQSFYAPALKAVDRKTDLSKAARNIRTLMHSGNIHVHIDLIAGLPYETLPRFANSFNLAYRLRTHHLQLGFLKLLHGSRIRKEFKSIRHNEAPPYEIVSSPWLSVYDINVLKQVENALQNTHNKGRFLSALQYVLSVTKLPPFLLYHKIGETIENHGMPPEIYADKIYHFLNALQGVDSDMLLECIICDWLSMVKGVNMPDFMRIYNKQRYIQIRETAQILLGRKIHRNEAAVLPSGRGVFVDSEDCDMVTGLYKLYFC